LVERYDERAIGGRCGREVLEAARVESDQHDVNGSALFRDESGDLRTVGFGDVQGHRRCRGLRRLRDEGVTVGVEARWHGARLGGPWVCGLLSALPGRRRPNPYAVPKVPNSTSTNASSRQVPSVPSRTQQSLDRPRRLVDEILGAVTVAARRSAGDAVLQVLVEQLHADTLQCLADRGDLCEHVDAVGAVLDHPSEAADLTFDARRRANNCCLSSE
jgi:hypothetical protein